MSVTKRMQILKSIVLADFAKKSAKNKHSENGPRREDPNRMKMLKESLNVVALPSELKPLQYNVLLLCKAQQKRIYSVIVFPMFWKTFHSRNNALCDRSKVCQLQEQKVSEGSDLYCFQKSQKEYVNNLSEVYRK